MKLAFICNELPYPPIHGGRVDVWRRIQAFKRAGAEIHLICWGGDRPEEALTLEQQKELAKYTASFTVFPISRRLLPRIFRLVNMVRFPDQVAARLVADMARQDMTDILQKAGVQAVWLESIYGGELAKGLSFKFGVPYFVRSHNIEHQYMLGQMKLASTLRGKFDCARTVLHLRRYEDEILRNSAAYFDISVDDLEFWKGKGLSRGHWLPPFVDDTTQLSTQELPVPEFDAAYLGNLFTPNNVQAVEWLLTQVLPRLVLLKKGSARVLIAGSKPSRRVRHMCQGNSHVTLLENPSDARATLQRAAVLVNPVLFGSGVNVKSIEMLFAGRPVVSTPQGVHGLPESVKACFTIAGDADDFAQGVADAGNVRDNPGNKLNGIARLFDFGAAGAVLDTVKRYL